MTADELATCWTTRWPRPSETSNKQYAYMVRHWGKANAGVALEDYTREMARSYGLEYPSRVKALRAMWNDIMRDELTSHTQNPFSALRITKPRKERYFPSEEEVQTLIRAAEEPLRGRIRFSAYTGLRLGEMLAVLPKNLNGDHSRVEVAWQINPEGKRVARKGKLPSYVATVPEPARLAVANPLFPWHRPVYPLPRHRHNKEWNALRRRLKLPASFVWHSLRHHAATWFLDQGASFEDVAIQLGHSDNGSQVRDTYGHMSRDKALDRLEAVVSA